MLDAERVVRQSAGQSERTEGAEIRVAGLTVQHEDAESVSTVVFNPVVQQRQTDGRQSQTNAAEAQCVIFICWMVGERWTDKTTGLPRE